MGRRCLQYPAMFVIAVAIATGTTSTPRAAADTGARRISSSLSAGADIVAINAGGPAAATWVADEGYTSNGTWIYATSNAIITNGVTDPAPAAVYSSQRTGATTYTVGGLTAGAPYSLRLHFAELWFTAAGKRVFNVTVNGVTVVSGLDLYAAAGGEFKAPVKTLAVNADSAGQLAIGFVPVINAPTVNGIEVQTAVAGPTPTPASSPQDNLTYHNSNARIGWYSHETSLTAAVVASSAFHQLATLPTAGKSFSQPLYLSAQKIANGTTHNVLLVADSSDVVYAYDADTYGLLWKRDFTGPGVRQQLTSDVECDDEWPNMGITGTPVVDRALGRMYVVVPTIDNGVPRMRLRALSLLNGADAVNPVDVAVTVPMAGGGAASIEPLYNVNRAGLLETNGTIYVGLSTHCDYDPDDAHGWLMAYDARTLARAADLTITDKDVGKLSGVRFLGGIWQGGYGIAADARSNIYVATGNGPNDGAIHDDAMSVLKLPPNLNAAQRTFFTPSTWLKDSQHDLDLGSGGVMLLPDQTAGPFAHLAIAGGKTGMKYLLNRDNLGGLSTPDHIPYEAVTDAGVYGGPAYFVDSSGKQKIVYGGTPSLNAFTLTTAPTYGLTLTSSSTVGSLENRNTGVAPIVSSNGTVAGSAVVWALKVQNAVNDVAAVTLFGFDGANLAHTVCAVTAGRWSEIADSGGHLITPLVANGRVYVATDGEVTVWGTH